MAATKQEIEAILARVPHKVTQIGPLWQITVGEHAGARENGISLARDLLARYRRDVGEAAPVEKVVYRDSPETLAEIETLRKANAARDAEAALMSHLDTLEDTKAKLKERPEAPEPEPEEVVPDEIKQALKEAGIDWRDSREAVSNALIAKYRYYKGAAEYARTNGTFDGRGVIYWEKKAEGIDDATAWNRARKVETL